MNPRRHCSASIFEEEFKFQYVRGDIHIRISTKNIILLVVSLHKNSLQEFSSSL